jgi:hypothetical protein
MVRDIVGKKFGRLTAIQRVDWNKGQTIWECKCDCGKKVEIPYGSLKSGNTKSCGCLAIETRRKNAERLNSDPNKKTNLDDLTSKRFGQLLVTKLIDNEHYECKCDCGEVSTYTRESLTHDTKDCGCVKFSQIKQKIIGKQFGRLTVISFSHSNGNAYIWDCQCECGKMIKCTTNVLNMGHTKSCGCFDRDLKKERRREKHPRWNKNLTDEDRWGDKHRNLNPAYVEWRDAVYKRDNYCCRICSGREGGIKAHHKQNYSMFRELRCDVENGVALCDSCHKKIHERFGKFTTLENWAEFEKEHKQVPVAINNFFIDDSRIESTNRRREVIYGHQERVI